VIREAIGQVHAVHRSLILVAEKEGLYTYVSLSVLP
jgi:hypothetical protein